LVSSTKQRRRQLRSTLDETGLASAAKHVGKLAERSGLLFCRIRKLLRTARLRRHTTQSRQQPRYRGTDGGLEHIAIKTKCGCDTSDHFRR
jgi:hypothetical protein